MYKPGRWIGRCRYVCVSESHSHLKPSIWRRRAVFVLQVRRVHFRTYQGHRLNTFVARRFTLRVLTEPCLYRTFARRSVNPSAIDGASSIRVLCTNYNKNVHASPVTKYSGLSHWLWEPARMIPRFTRLFSILKVNRHTESMAMKKQPHQTSTFAEIIF